MGYKKVEKIMANLLTQADKEICTKISIGEDSIHKQRATVLLLIDRGSTQANAGTKTGLSIGQVRYVYRRYKNTGIDVFPQSVRASEEVQDEKLKEEIIEEIKEEVIEEKPQELKEEPVQEEIKKETPTEEKPKKAKKKAKAKKEKTPKEEIKETKDKKATKKDKEKKKEKKRGSETKREKSH